MRGLWQECGFALLVLQNHFCRESCFSPASYSLVLDYFSCGFGLWVCTSWLSFPLFLSLPSHRQWRREQLWDIFVFVYLVKLCRQLPLCLRENKPGIVKIFEIIIFNLLSQQSCIDLNVAWQYGYNLKGTSLKALPTMAPFLHKQFWCFGIFSFRSLRGYFVCFVCVCVCV